MKRIKLLSLRAGALSLVLAAGYTASAQWTGIDVGNPGVAGSDTAGPNGSITLTGGGGDIWGTADQMYYYYQNVTGLWWDSVVQVLSLDGTSSTWAKTELMARLDDGSMTPTAGDPFICAMTTPAGAGQNELGDQFRASPPPTGGANWVELTSPVWRPTYPHQWMRLERVGSVFNVYFSTDGSTWNLYFSQDTATTANGFDGNAWSNRVLVGVAVTGHNNASSTTTVISNLSLTIHPLVPPTGALKVSRQIQDAVTNYAYSAISFSFAATNNGAPQLLYPNAYQWFKNGKPVASQTNVAGGKYSFLATPADDGAQVYCQVTTPGYELPALNSSTGTVAVLSAAFYTNGVKIERFMGALRTDVESGFTGPADSTRVSTGNGSASTLTYTGFENLLNDGINNYSERLSGWFVPPTTDHYTFFICSDDDSDLFLSTDSTPGNKTLIAHENAWSASREWTNSSGLSVLSQKRSDQWTNDTGVAQYPNGFLLTAGTPYYIEAVHHQAGGGENIGVLALAVGSPDPTNGAPPIPSSQLVLASHAPTTLTWTSSPQPATVFESGVPVFTAAAKSDSEFVPLYQWRYNGTNIAGATGTSYSFTTIASDNGAEISVVAATAEGGLAITNTATLTVQKAAFEQGLALMQYWINQTGGSPEGNPPVQPPATFEMAVPAFEAGINNENGDSYVNKVSGFFIPATTGTYDFIVTGDDGVDLFLSTDANPNNKRLICQEPGWSAQLTWGTDGGGGNGVPQKHSATWTNANSAGLAPFASGFQLTAGTKYYIEMWHHEGTSGDSCAATFTMRTGGVIAPDPADGTESAIRGSLLGFNTPAAHYVDFLEQPTNATVVSGNTATFTALGDSDGKLPIGTTGQFQTSTAAGATNFVSFPTVLFQWYKNGTLIPGATTPSYTTPPLKPADNNAQYVAAIRALGYPSWSNSTPAVVTVITDTNKPTVFAAVFDENGLPVMSVSFSKMMDLATITNLANYTLTGGGGGVSAYEVVVDTNDVRHIQLKLTTAPTGPITLTLNGIKDFSGNSLVSSSLTVAQSPLANADIGDVFATLGQAGFIGFPGYLYADGPGAYTIACEGSDIWDVSDGFNFSYETKTNDFDVAVRQVSFTKVSNWSKGGLMVREDLTAGSRNWNMVNDPTSADGIRAIDGSGTGANTVESNCRTTTSMASGGWGVGPGTTPAYPNAWLRIKRTGQILRSYWSSNAVQWVQQGLADVSTNANGKLPDTLYVGICGTAHANDSYSATELKYVYTASFADYNSAYVAPTNTIPATVSASSAAGNIVISWTPAGGTLQSTPTLGQGAAWTTVGTANPATIPVSGTAKFFRVAP